MVGQANDQGTGDTTANRMGRTMWPLFNAIRLLAIRLFAESRVASPRKYHLREI